MSIYQAASIFPPINDEKISEKNSFKTGKVAILKSQAVQLRIAQVKTENGKKSVVRDILTLMVQKYQKVKPDPIF